MSTIGASPLEEASSLENSPLTAAGPPRPRRVLWALIGVAVVAVAGGTAGAYFGLRGALGGSGSSPSSPLARAYAAAAYDDATHEVVLFGGIDQKGAALGDTWTWNGSAWTAQRPQVSPPPLAHAQMTYDPRSRDVLLVGGGPSPGGVTCSGRASASAGSASGAVVPPGAPAPAPRLTPPAGSATAPLPTCSASPTVGRQDTWLWDGAQWHRSGAAPPPGLGLAGPGGLATDPATGEVLLMTPEIPGYNTSLPSCPVPASGSSTPPVACRGVGIGPSPVQIWSWSGSAWVAHGMVQPATGSVALPAGIGTLVADPGSGHLEDFRGTSAVVCGEEPTGAAGPAPCPLGGGSESAPPAVGVAGTPQATVLPAPAQPKQPNPIAFATGSVSVWNGSGWSAPAAFSTGPNVFQALLAGDEARHDVVAFAPEGTWTWAASSWTQQHPARSPGRVTGAVLVDDAARGRVLLFGGLTPPHPIAQGVSNELPGVSDELWAWDGTTWTQLGGTAPPSPTASPTPTAAPSPSLLPAPLPSPPPPGSSPVPGVSPLPCLAPNAGPGALPTPVPTCPPPTAPPAGG